jgi:hypothetical protein
MYTYGRMQYYIPAHQDLVMIAEALASNEHSSSGSP